MDAQHAAKQGWPRSLHFLWSIHGLSERTEVYGLLKHSLPVPFDTAFQGIMKKRKARAWCW